MVMKWDYFANDTIGKQFCIAANLSEGYGRYHYLEAKHFGYYSRGSLFETKTWLIKAHRRKLMNDETCNRISAVLDTIGIKLNNYINSIGKKHK